MLINDFLYRAAKKLNRLQKPLLKYTAKEQTDYMASLGVPVNDFERSFFQYKCQMKLKGVGWSFVINFASFPLALIYLAKAKHVKDFSSEGHSMRHNRTACVVGPVSPKIIPSVLKNEFSSLVFVAESGDKLSSLDFKLIAALIQKYPLSWHFIFKCIIKLMQYRSAVDEASPYALIVSNEYSFTSSLMTYHYENQGLEIINVMHGEKLFDMTDSFFRFSRCYVWEESFIELFIDLRADEGQFFICMPEALLFDSRNNVDRRFNYAYYLSDETNDTLRAIEQNLSVLKECGNRIKVRPHPIYTDTETMNHIFSDYTIEDGNSVPIDQSILESSAVIARMSTVLRQAWHNGVKAIIDDCSDPVLFERLSDLRYSMLNEDVALLSREIDAARLHNAQD